MSEVLLFEYFKKKIAYRLMLLWCFITCGKQTQFIQVCQVCVVADVAFEPWVQLNPYFHMEHTYIYIYLIMNPKFQKYCKFIDKTLKVECIKIKFWICYIYSLLITEYILISRICWFSIDLSCFHAPSSQIWDVNILGTIVEDIQMCSTIHC